MLELGAIGGFTLMPAFSRWEKGFVVGLGLAVAY